MGIRSVWVTNIFLGLEEQSNTGFHFWMHCPFKNDNPGKENKLQKKKYIYICENSNLKVIYCVLWSWLSEYLLHLLFIVYYILRCGTWRNAKISFRGEQMNSTFIFSSSAKCSTFQRKQRLWWGHKSMTKKTLNHFKCLLRFSIQYSFYCSATLELPLPLINVH